MCLITKSTNLFVGSLMRQELIMSLNDLEYLYLVFERSRDGGWFVRVI